MKQNIKQGTTSAVKTEARNMLLQHGFRIDYLELVDADTLAIVENWDGKQKIVGLAAAFLNNVRLIDNMVINP